MSEQHVVKISEIPEGKTFEDYADDTVFELNDHDDMEDDSYWEDVE